MWAGGLSCLPTQRLPSFAYLGRSCSESYVDESSDLGVSVRRADSPKNLLTLTFFWGLFSGASVYCISLTLSVSYLNLLLGSFLGRQRILHLPDAVGEFDGLLHGFRGVENLFPPRSPVVTDPQIVDLLPGHERHLFLRALFLHVQNVPSHRFLRRVGVVGVVLPQIRGPLLVLLLFRLLFALCCRLAGKVRRRRSLAGPFTGGDGLTGLVGGTNWAGCGKTDLRPNTDSRRRLVRSWGGARRGIWLALCSLEHQIQNEQKTMGDKRPRDRIAPPK